MISVGGGVMWSETRSELRFRSSGSMSSIRYRISAAIPLEGFKFRHNEKRCSRERS